MVLLHIILEDMSSQQMLQESNREHRIPYHLLNLVDITRNSDNPVQSASSVGNWIFCWIRWYNEVLYSKPRIRQNIKCALCTLYHALSLAISLCAIFVPYLCTIKQAPAPRSLHTAPALLPIEGEMPKRQRGSPRSPAHPSSLPATLSPLNNLPSPLPAEVQHATQSIFYILCKQSLLWSSIFLYLCG